MLMINLKTNLTIEADKEQSFKEEMLKISNEHLSARESSVLICEEYGKKLSLGNNSTNEPIAVLDIKAYEKLPEIQCNRFATKMSEVMEKNFGVKRENVYTIFEKSVYWANNNSGQVLENKYLPIQNGMFISPKQRGK